MQKDKSEKMSKNRPEKVLPISLELTEAHKAEYADQLLSIQRQIVSVTKEAKEASDGYKQELKELEAEMTELFTQLDSGMKTEDRRVIIRKNLKDYEVPMLEYLNPDNEEVLQTTPMDEHDMQVTTEDWVVGQEPEPGIV